MKSVHVCLVSDQTTPNILAIHHFQPDEILFVTTPDMEKKQKTAHILAALRLAQSEYEGQYSKVTVPEDSILEAHRRLEEWSCEREDAEFVVNLTCGTKIMAIAVYEFFKDYGARMIYIPLPKNEFITPFPKRQGGKPSQLELRLTVSQYLAAYGLKVTNSKSVTAGIKDAHLRRELAAWIVSNYDQLKSLLERLNDKLRRKRDEHCGYLLKTTYVPISFEERELLRRLNFEFDESEHSKHLSKSEICFITGGWLEEYCYNEVERLVGKGIDDAVIGVKIMNSLKRDNEFDVMFTKDNALYTIECKSLDQNDDPKADALYKIAALQKEFGLRAESFFVSNSPHILREGIVKPAIVARAEQFRTTIIPPGEVAIFGERLKEKLNLL